MDPIARKTKDTQETDGVVIQFVTFRLADAEYAVNIMQTKEIIRMERITLIPNAPDFVEGVINLRGNVIPVIDLKKRFHLKSGENDTSSCIIIVRIDKMEMGIIIDAISKVMHLPQSDVQPPPAVLAGIGEKYINGVAKIDERLVMILDLEKLFTFDEQESLKKL
ncbi:MAG: purine-binding chemotaxis protein CheW [Spirochaetes bacterium]|nr:purine-binding chemotaxis protein CheW [Spirochaetota bacterium]